MSQNCLDSIPSLIRELARALTAEPSPQDGEERGRELGANAQSHIHAAERIAEGYHLGGAIRELSLFRAELIEFVYENGGFPDGESAVLVHSAIDERIHIVATSIEGSARARIQESEERLREDALFRERFIGVLAHDLRSPLTSIKASAALLLKQSLRDPAQTDSVRRIARSGDRMARMITDVLELSTRLHGGEIPVRRRPGTFTRSVAKRSKRWPASFRRARSNWRSAATVGACGTRIGSSRSFRTCSRTPSITVRQTRRCASRSAIARAPGGSCSKCAIRVVRSPTKIRRCCSSRFAEHTIPTNREHKKRAARPRSVHRAGSRADPRRGRSP